jgi:TatD DNase family protein
MIDVHCHIDQFRNPLEIAKRAEDVGIITIAVTSLPDHFKLGYPHLSDFKRVRLALGYHPMFVGDKRFDERLFKALALKTSYIGEIGLDFSDKAQSKKQQQINTLRKIFKIINDRSRFISVHSRRAESDLLDLLYDYKIENAVFHWYSGPLTLIDKVISAGHYFSINPLMIKSKKGQKIIDRIPPDRILTETDGPYVKIRGRPAEPKDVKLILEYLKIIWSKSFEDVEKRVYMNFKTLISHIPKNI